MSEFVNSPLIKPNTIEMRLYQTVLSAIAIQDNSLIALPTGLGKTVLVVLASAFFLSNHPGLKIVVTAPTRPLVHQHLQSFQTALDIPEWEIVELSGQTTKIKRKDIWKNAQVIICTPQILRNDIINEFLDLTKVSFLCIDECHRMVGNDASVLPSKLFQQRNKAGRILGITASPGSLEKVYEIIENLGATRIEYRDENSADVKPYIYNRDENIVYVELPSDFKKITQNLELILKELLLTLTSNGIQIETNPAKIRKKDLLEKSKLLWSNFSEWEDKQAYYSASNAITDAIRLHQANEMLESQGIPTLYNYLDGRKKEYNRTRKQSLKRFLDLLSSYQIQEKVEKLLNDGLVHPKLEALKKILIEVFKKDKSSRVLIFSNFRTTVKTLNKEINRLPEVESQWFIGQTTSEKDTGLKQKEQIEILDMFRRGSFNVLVSTSVGEEGLDVAQCDAVIFYDIVPSATRTIQRSGRTGRKREGKVIFLIAKGTRDEGYYYASKARKRKLESVMWKIKQEISKTKKGCPVETKADKQQSHLELDSFDESSTKLVSYKKSNAIVEISHKNSATTSSFSIPDKKRINNQSKLLSSILVKSDMESTKYVDEDSSVSSKNNSSNDVSSLGERSKGELLDKDIKTKIIVAPAEEFPLLIVDVREKANSILTHLTQMKIKIKNKKA